MNRVWDASDFLLDGTFAPVDAVTSAFCALADEHLSEPCLLLAMSNHTMFGSLCHIFVPGLGAEVLQLDLKGDRVAPLTQQLRSAFRRKSMDTVAGLLAGHCASAAQSSVVSQLTGAVTWLSSPDEVDLQLAIVSNHTFEDARVDNATASELLMTAACTSQVALLTADKRAAVATRRLTGLFEPGAIPTSPSEPHASLALVTSAIEILSASWGAVYLSSGQQLSIAASTRVPQHYALDPKGPPDDSTAARAFAQNKTFVRDDETVLSVLRSANGGPLVGNSELSLPLHNPATGSGPIGVVVVGRSGAEPFASGDIHMVRDLANRFQAVTLQQFSDRVLDFLSDPPSPDRSRAPMERLHYDLGSSVPADVAECVPSFDRIVATLASHPQINSASLRMLSADRTRLVRLAIAPIERKRDDFATVAINHGSSVAAACFRLAIPIELPNLDRSSDFRRYGLTGVLRPGPTAGAPQRETKAELCVPVVSDGHVIGVLNCESARKDALTDALQSVKALAAAAGNVVSAYQRRLEQIVLQLSSRQFATTHTLLHISDTLKRVDVPIETKVHTLAEGIVSTLTTGTTELLDSKRGPESVRSVTEAAVNQFDEALHVVRIVKSLSDLNLTSSAEVSRALYLTLVETIHNAFENSPSASGMRVVNLAWDYSTESRSGKQSLQIDISNRLKPDRRPPPVLEMFRVPTGSAEDRLHVGAFTSGVLLRSCGGDIWVADCSPEHIRVRLEIPLSAPGAGPQ